MDFIKFFIPIFCLFITSSTVLAQKKNNFDFKEIFLPFKRSIIYNGQTNEDILTQIKRGEEPATNLNIKFTDYFVTIYNYGVNETVIEYVNSNKPIYLEDIDREEKVDIKIIDINECYLLSKQDSLYLNEWFFNDLSNKILKITPIDKNKDINFKISVQLAERIWQQKPNEVDYQDWENIADEWKGLSPSIQIKDSAQYFFRIPEIQTLSDFPQLKKTLNLRDTLSVIEGEYDDVATIIYKNRPAHFIIDDIIVRIDQYLKENLIETKYIRIVLSYGC